MDVLLPISAALIALGVLLLWRRYGSSPRTLPWQAQPAVESPEKSSYEAIEPLSNFDWATTQPIRIRPFTPKYHMTMALQNMELSDLVAMDSTYSDRMHVRRSTMDDHPEATKQCNKVAEPAVLEFYDWMVSTYLPRRFPTIYKPTTNASGEPQLYNSVSETNLPVRPISPMAALDTLGEHVDTDFLILLPSSTAPDGMPIYHLEAFVTCFPAGFSTREKCGNPLAAIHKPVPGYKAKLEKSMDRFFAKLEVGRAVKRANWSISTNDKLYSEGGNHMYDDDKQDKQVENAKTLDVDSPDLDSDIERQKHEVVVDDCRLRCERQTLHRLPNTKALVFSFKTFMYKLSEVKEEGLGPELAEAIDGLAQGSVPAIAVYKRGVVWGDKVKKYLLS